MTDDVAERMTARVEELSRRCQEILHGQGPMIQSAVLADLMSLWLAGHIVFGDELETEQAREAMLAQWLETVRALVPESEKEILSRSTPPTERRQ